MEKNKHLNKQKICEECRNVFVRETEERQYCFSCASILESWEKKNAYYRDVHRKAAVTCFKCKRVFYRKSTRAKYCGLCTRPYGPRIEMGKKVQKVEDLDTFLNEKKPTPSRSIKQLNNQAEYKRVYGKGAWDHYLKGRKWDKI